MSLASLRYFGVKLVDLELASLRTDATLGRFVPVADPLPVGTTVELDGVTHRIVRVEEGLTPGVWLWTDGVAFAPMGDLVTAREMSADAVPTHIDNAPTIATPSEAAPSEAAPSDAAPSEELAATPSEGSPSEDLAATPSEKTDEVGRKRRRRGKTQPAQ